MTRLSDIAAEKGIRYFLVSFSDLRGVQRAKALRKSAEGSADVGEIAHAAAEFARDIDGGADALDVLEIFRDAAESRIEIHDVEPVGAGVLPFFGEGDGIVRVNGFFRGEAALEADDFAAHEVDGGEQQHFS